MASNSETNELQSLLERLIASRNRDLSFFIPFLLGFTRPEPDHTRPDSAQTTPDADHNLENPSTHDDDNSQNQRDRIILINPLTQGMVVIEGTGLDNLFRGISEKSGPPPASKSSVEMMPRVEIREDDEGECVICLEECVKGEVVKEMPCKHKFHEGCIEKWLSFHGSCPICRFRMPVEEDEPEKKGEEDGRERRRGRREIWVSFSLGGGNGSGSDNGDHSQVEGG